MSYQVVTVFLALGITFCGYKKLAIFTTNVDAENQTFVYHKTVCGVPNRQFLVGAVIGWRSVQYVYKSIVVGEFICH